MLARYSFEVKHVEGKRNIITDVLSWLTTEEKVAETIIDERKSEVSNIEADEYEILKQVIQTESWNMIQNDANNPAIQRYLQKFKKMNALLSVAESEVYYKDRIPVPSQNQIKEILKRAHIGHMGRIRTVKRITQYYWWPGIHDKVSKLL